MYRKMTCKYDDSYPGQLRKLVGGLCFAIIFATTRDAGIRLLASANSPSSLPLPKMSLRVKNRKDGFEGSRSQSIGVSPIILSHPLLINISRFVYKFIQSAFVNQTPIHSSRESYSSLKSSSISNLGYLPLYSSLTT